MSAMRCMRTAATKTQLTEGASKLCAPPAPFSSTSRHLSSLGRTSRPKANTTSKAPRPRQQCLFHTSPRPQRYGSGPHRRRPRYSDGPHFDPIKAANAKPLITIENLKAVGRSTKFRTIVVLTSGSLFIFYVTHIETVPVSGRRRFNCYSEESAEEQGVIAYQQIVQQAAQAGALVPKWDPRVRRVEKVLQRLIDGGNLGTGQIGEDYPGRKVGWEVHLIEDPHQANAFVLPGGKVIVFSGILPICKNNDGLAAVLGHEIAHNIAQHACEKMSQMVLLQPIVWGLIYADYTGLTFGLGRFLGSFLLDLGILRPSSRAQETEADKIGLMLMADACYDPKHAMGLWERMEKHQQDAPPEWLSTHPSNKSRIQQITEWLPEAEERYLNKGCSQMAGYKDAFQDAITKPIVFYV